MDIVRLVLTSTLQLTVVGIVLGLAAAAVLTRFMKALLFGVQPLDVMTFTSVAAVLMMTALVASLAPLIRAARVDPLVTLRYE